jgi:hypothetical protein
VSTRPHEDSAGAPLELARMKVSGMSLEGDTLWLASIRDKLVARVVAGVCGAAAGTAHGEVVLTYAHPVADVAPMPEGLWMVAGGGSEGRQCALWSLAEGREIRRFDCPGGAGGGLAWYRERLWLTHRHNRRLLVLDPASGAVERTIATEHEIFSPSVAAGALWFVEAKTGPFGRFSPPSESTYFFSRFDPDAERTVERLAAPASPAAMATDGTRFWFAPRDGTGVVCVAGSALAVGSLPVATPGTR